MPAYGAVVVPAVPVLNAGMPIALWNNEDVDAGGKSQAFCMHRSPDAATVLSAEIVFDADPGVFQIDFQTADTNVEENFVTKASLDADLNANFVGRIEIVNVVAKFGRFLMVAKANGTVKVTLKVS